MNLTASQLVLFIALSVIPAMLISAIAVACLRRWAPNLGLVDQPAARKVHAAPVPLGGGVGIWLGFITPFALGSILVWLVTANPEWQANLPEWAVQHLGGVRSRLDSLWVILLAGTLLMLVGLMDDRFALGWKVRLGVQFLVAAFCVYWQDWGLSAFIQWKWITSGLTVIWIVAMINAFNMLDNMDGLSGGVGAIASLMLGTVMLLNHEPGSSQPQLFVAGMVFVLLGAILGFLFHNRPPAKIFMGDAGSYFIGFTLSMATLLGTYADYRDRPLAVLTPLFIMAVPMYDMISVIIIRLREGRSPFEADKNHLSHRLVELGFSKPQAVATIYLLTATCGLGALLLHRLDSIGVSIVTGMVLCVLCLIAVIEVTARRKVRGAEAASTEAASTEEASESGP